MGAGVLDRLLELGADVVGFNGGEAPIEKERFINPARGALLGLREMFEEGLIDIDPDDDQLAAQLGAMKWTVDSRGRIKIESKNDMRKRGLPSPDRADALCMTLVEGWRKLGRRAPLGRHDNWRFTDGALVTADRTGRSSTLGR